MFLLFLPILSHQEIQCEQITSLLKSDEENSLTCSGLSPENTYQIKLSSDHTSSTLDTTFESPNTLKFSITNPDEFTQMYLIDQDSEIFIQNIKIDAKPTVKDVGTNNKQPFLGRWIEYTYEIKFGSSYTGSGEDKYEVAIINSPTESENSFTDYKVILKNANDKNYFFIPKTVTPGENFLLFRFHLVNGETDTVSKTFIPPIHVLIPKVSDKITAEKTSTSMFFDESNTEINFGVYCTPSVYSFKVYYKIGSYEDTLFGEYEGLVTDPIYIESSINIPTDLTEVQEKVTFIMKDTATSQILAYTEYTDLIIVPKFEVENITLANHNMISDYYVLHNQEPITGTVTFKNEVAFDYLILHYKLKRQTLKPFGKSKRNFFFIVQLGDIRSENLITLNFEQNNVFKNGYITYKYVEFTYSVKYFKKDEQRKGTFYVKHNIPTEINIGGRFYESSTIANNYLQIIKKASKIFSLGFRVSIPAHYIRNQSKI